MNWTMISILLFETNINFILLECYNYMY
jgi:hypothetical protein